MASIGRKSVNKKTGFFAALILAMTLPSSAYACPMCGDILERGKDAVAALRFSLGIGWSILAMLAVLYGMVGGFIFLIWKSQKKAARERQERISGGIQN